MSGDESWIGVPVAFAAVASNGTPLWLSYDRRDASSTFGKVVELYRKPLLTDAEREAIAWAINVTTRTYDDPDGGPLKREALRGLLGRMGGER